MNQHVPIESGGVANQDASGSIASILKSRAQQQAQPLVRFARHCMTHATATVTAGTNSAQDAAANTYLVTVLSGRHAGAVARIEKRAFSIGSDFARDVIVTDTDVAATHLEIIPQRGLLSAIAVKASAPDVVVAGEVVEEGQTINAYLPADIRMGDVRLRISGSGTDETSVKINWRPVVAAALIGVLVAVLWPAINSLARTVTAGMSGAVGEVDKMIAGTDTRALNTAVAALAEARLEPQITIAKHGDGLIARGLVSSAKHSQWSEVKRALAAKGFSIVDQVHTSSSSEPSRDLIAAISLGDFPHVVTTSGKKVRIGEALDGGWIIKELRSNAVVVERGAVKTTITP